MGRNRIIFAKSQSDLPKWELEAYSFGISTGVSGDDQPLPKSKHSLLTSVGYRFLFNNVL